MQLTVSLVGKNFFSLDVHLVFFIFIFIHKKYNKGTNLDRVLVPTSRRN